MWWLLKALIFLEIKGIPPCRKKILAHQDFPRQKGEGRGGGNRNENVPDQGGIPLFKRRPCKEGAETGQKDFRHAKRGKKRGGKAQPGMIEINHPNFHVQKRSSKLIGGSKKSKGGGNRRPDREERLRKYFSLTGRPLGRNSWTRRGGEENPRNRGNINEKKGPNQSDQESEHTNLD